MHFFCCFLIIMKYFKTSKIVQCTKIYLNILHLRGVPLTSDLIMLSDEIALFEVESWIWDLKLVFQLTKLMSEVLAHLNITEGEKNKTCKVKQLFHFLEKNQYKTCKNSENTFLIGLWFTSFVSTTFNPSCSGGF